MIKHTWKTNSTFSMDTPMNLPDTSNVPMSLEVISNTTFLNLKEESNGMEERRIR